MKYLKKLDWKKDLYKKIEALKIDNLIITSNTSGLSASDLVDGMSDKFKKRLIARIDTKNNLYFR